MNDIFNAGNKPANENKVNEQPKQETKTDVQKSEVKNEVKSATTAVKKTRNRGKNLSTLKAELEKAEKQVADLKAQIKVKEEQERSESFDKMMSKFKNLAQNKGKEVGTKDFEKFVMSKLESEPAA